MKIIVAIKQVPERDAQVRINSSGKWIEESGLQYALNEFDAYALEETLAKGADRSHPVDISLFIERNRQPEAPTTYPKSA